MSSEQKEPSSASGRPWPLVVAAASLVLGGLGVYHTLPAPYHVTVFTPLERFVAPSSGDNLPAIPHVFARAADEPQSAVSPVPVVSDATAESVGAVAAASNSSTNPPTGLKPEASLPAAESPTATPTIQPSPTPPPPTATPTVPTTTPTSTPQASATPAGRIMTFITPTPAPTRRAFPTPSRH